MRPCPVCNGRGFTEEDGSVIGRAFLMGYSKGKEGSDPRDELIAEAVELFRDVGPAAGHSDRYYRIQAWLARAAALGKGEA